MRWHIWLGFCSLPKSMRDARAALRAVERVREHCAGWAGLDKGTLRIGSVASCATRLLPDRLRAFRSRYPRIEIVLLEATDGEICERVMSGFDTKVIDTARRLGAARGLRMGRVLTKPIRAGDLRAVLADFKHGLKGHVS